VVVRKDWKKAKLCLYFIEMKSKWSLNYHREEMKYKPKHSHLTLLFLDICQITLIVEKQVDGGKKKHQINDYKKQKYLHGVTEAILFIQASAGSVSPNFNKN
jgi:hypothetical protein